MCSTSCACTCAHLRVVQDTPAAVGVPWSETLAAGWVLTADLHWHPGELQWGRVAQPNIKLYIMYYLIYFKSAMKKKMKAQICLYLQVLLLNTWQPQSSVSGTVCSLGLWGRRVRALWYTVLPIYAGIDWHWLARLLRDQSAQPGQIPSSCRHGNSKARQ